MKLKNIALSGLAIGLATISTAGFTKMTAPVNDISVTVGCPVLVVCRVTYNSKSKWLNARGQGKIVNLTVDKWAQIRVYFDIKGERKIHTIKMGVKDFSIEFTKEGKYIKKYK